MKPLDCAEARSLLLARRRGELGDELAERLDEHLAGCAACRHEDAADRELSTVLEQRLARPAAPDGLRQRLRGRYVGSSTRPPSRLPVRLRRAAAAVAGALAGAALTASLFLAWPSAGGSSSSPLVTEAVNDHLRGLYTTHPPEVASGGIHQVEPWFTGRLDFAPIIAFSGDDEFPLQGGSVAYFVDRKAAAYSFKRRLHAISVFVFRADGLAWPNRGLVELGRVRASITNVRGFHVVLFRDGDLGYALVSDVAPVELETLAKKIAGTTPPK